MKWSPDARLKEKAGGCYKFNGKIKDSCEERGLAVASTKFVDYGVYEGFGVTEEH